MPGPSRTARLTRAAATAGLAVVGSHAGYQLVRHTVRTTLTGVVRLAGAGLRLLGRALTTVGSGVSTAVALFSPATADLLDHVVREWILEPISAVTMKAAGWAQEAAAAVWDLSSTSLVQPVTVRAAQVASVILGVHALTKGAVASKIVQALPWSMDAILVITNPAWAALLVAGAFTAALVVAAFRVLEGPDDDPAGKGTVVAEPTVRPTPVTVRTLPSAPVDMREVAAQLYVEVAPDGSVLVHGIPNDLPDDIGLHVAQIAAEATTARLERILLRKPFPNNDDRRLLTKIARETVRGQGMLHAAS